MLSIPVADKSHSGLYKCIATNVAGSAEKTFEIDVKGKWKRLAIWVSYDFFPLSEELLLFNTFWNSM